MVVCEKAYPERLSALFLILQRHKVQKYHAVKLDLLLETKLQYIITSFTRSEDLDFNITFVYVDSFLCYVYHLPVGNFIGDFNSINT